MILKRFWINRSPFFCDRRSNFFNQITCLCFLLTWSFFCLSFGSIIWRTISKDRWHMKLFSQSLYSNNSKRNLDNFYSRGCSTTQANPVNFRIGHNWRIGPLYPFHLVTIVLLAPELFCFIFDLELFDLTLVWGLWNDYQVSSKRCSLTSSSIYIGQ